jgi:hypothetical protein
MLNWIFMYLAHWNSNLQIDSSSHSYTLSWFQDSLRIDLSSHSYTLSWFPDNLRIDLSSHSYTLSWFPDNLRIELSFHSYTLAWFPDNLRIELSSHSYTLSWFPDNQSLLFLLNAAYLAEKQQMPIYSLWFESMIYHNRGEHANHYTTDAGRPVWWFHEVIHSFFIPAFFLMDHFQWFLLFYDFFLYVFCNGFWQDCVTLRW